jgi:hypothetical protein
MQDEARHVAFGRLALHDYYAQLTAAGPGGFLFDYRFSFWLKAGHGRSLINSVNVRSFSARPRAESEITLTSRRRWSATYLRKRSGP